MRARLPRYGARGARGCAERRPGPDRAVGSALWAQLVGVTVLHGTQTAGDSRCSRSDGLRPAFLLAIDRSLLEALSSAIAFNKRPSMHPAGDQLERQGCRAGSAISSRTHWAAAGAAFALPIDHVRWQAAGQSRGSRSHRTAPAPRRFRPQDCARHKRLICRLTASFSA